MKTICISLVIILAFACNQQAGSGNVQDDTTINNNEKKETTDRGEQVDSPTGNLDGCYWKIMDRDTLVVVLQQDGQHISGRMTFDNYQKDGSTGTVKGRVEGSIIKLWYTFQSEGMQSIMEVFLKSQGDKLVRGNGDMDVSGDSTYYKDPNSISFTNQLVYDKVDCEKIPAKYK